MDRAQPGGSPPVTLLALPAPACPLQPAKVRELAGAFMSNKMQQL